MTRMHTNDTNTIIFPKLSYVITGCCFEAQRDLGRFCRERQYCDPLEQKFIDRGMSYARELTLPNEIMEGNRADFIIDDKILLEIKSVPYITKKIIFRFSVI